MSKVSRLEVIETGARRRWTLAEKLRIVAESQAGPRQVSATARRHGLLPAHLFTWRRLAREGRLGEEAAKFAQAVIGCEPGSPAVPLGTMSRSRIEIVLANGLRVIVEEDVDAGALARVIGALDRR
ncbi:MAG: transposase [Proteobacteria bacterium]|nr:transposase [Pseudomonadota bacterium]